jgi:hypothetical protein
MMRREKRQHFSPRALDGVAIKVSRFGEIPKPTVIVRMKENGSPCYDDSVSSA